ncbi:unnamed protein product, partial [marine sediment metagenome]
TVNLQFFAIDKDGEYHYMSPQTFKGKSCVFEEFTAYRHILLEVCYKVTGFKHGKHVDLEIENTFDRQYASRTLNQPASEPHKLRPAAVVDTDGASQQMPVTVYPPPPAAAGNPCQHMQEQWKVIETLDGGSVTICKACGERVG